MWAPGLSGGLCVCLEGDACSKLARATRPEAGRVGLHGGGKGRKCGSSIPGWSKAQWQPLGCRETSVGISAQAQGLDWQKEGSVYGGPRTLHPQDSRSPPQSQRGNPSPTLGTSAPRGAKGFRRNRFAAPPSPLPAPLSTKQSLLSNFKCYLRTAWPQPKAALWKLVFRCLPRLQVSKTHFRGGGGWGCIDASPHLVAGLAPNGHTDSHRPAPTEGHTLHAVACTPDA